MDIFSESQFFNTREVTGKVEDILPTTVDEIQTGPDDYEDKSESVGESRELGDEDQQANNAILIIYDEIVV